MTTSMRWRMAAALLALLLAPAAFAQTTADPPTNISYNFRTGVVTFTSGSCFDSNEVHYRHATTGNFARALRPGSSTNRGIRTGDALSVLADRSYVEVKMQATGDTGCTTSSAFTSTVTYTAVTLDSSPTPLDESNLNGAELTVTLGSDHAFGSSVSATSFELVSTPSVSGLSISSVAGSANRVRTLTLGFSGNIASSFDLKVRVLAAAHNGAANLTSFTGMSVAPDTDYDTDDDGLIEISTLQQLDAVRVDLDGDGAPNPGNRSTYRRAFPGSSAGMGCPVTAIDTDDDDCTGYELARHLDFDTDGDGDVDSNDPNSYASWTRIAGTFSAIFDGNGFNIANLTASGSADAALFENVSGTIRWLGLPNVNISSGGQYVAALAARVETAGIVIGCWSTGTVTATRTSGSAYAAGLVHHVSGRLAASFSTADVRARTYAGGLAEELNSTGTIVASYATGSVRSQSVGSLVRISRGSIRASYATGVPTDTSTLQADRDPSCFVHDASGATNTDNYCDTDLATVTTATGATGQTTSAMQTPTSATGIYAAWDDLDVNGNGTADEDPWHFGTSSQHPVLKYGAQDPGLQRGGDYDNDDDGLIEIHSLRQLNAMRWDLDGDGAPAAGNADDYASAFYDHPDDMGCPTTAIDADDNDCTGYELDTDLDFDTDGDGATWALSSGTPTSDGNDDYHNGGAGWAPIGSRSARFNTTFNGNGHVIENLFVNRNANDTGFFSATGTSARITSLGLEAARLRGGASSDNWGALVGYFQGRIAACWATGHVRANSTVGGLVGRAETSSVIVASYSTASVEITGATGRGAGLVSWVSGGSVRTSYSTGAVTGGQARAGFSDGFATVVASYWDTDLSNIGDDANSAPPEGRSTADLQGETTYAGTGIYGAWDDQDVDGDGTPGEATDDDAWDFGANWQHPVLKFGGFDTGLQFSLQPNLVPSFGTSVTAQTVQGGRAMQPLRIPAASGGNGPIAYSASGLPAGLSFDADGHGDCSLSRTICGTPSTNAVTTVTITASDADDNTQSSDQATLTFTMTVVTPSAAISATNPAALTETNLDNATVTVTLANTAFASGVTAASFTLTTAVPGLSIGAVATVSDGDTSATLTLDKDGADVTAIGSLSVTVAAAAHDLAGNLATGAVTVTPTVGLVLSTTSLMLEEDPTAGGATNANVGTYTIALSANPRTASGGACAVTITASSGNTDVAVDNDGTPQGRVLQFDQTNWNVAQTVTVTASDDGDSSDDTATIGHIRSGSGCAGGYFGFPTNLPSVSVNVNDDDTAGIVIDTVPATPNVVDPGPLALRELAIATDRSASYAVKLAALPTATVTVTITSSDTDAVTVDDTQATAGVQNTLMFTTANWDTAQTVTVRAVQDSDTNNETVTVTHAASTMAMSEYTGLSATLQATVEDDDAPGFVFDADPATSNLAEAGPLMLQELASGTRVDDYSVALSSQPTATVTVTIASGDPGAVLALDTDSIALGNQDTLTFTTANWNAPQIVWLAAVQDDDGADESVAIGHAASTAANSEYTGVSRDFGAFVDDDETPAITLSASTLPVPERRTATYTVALATPPKAGSVTVAITGAADGIGANPASLSFTAANWDTARTVTVSAADDQNSANEMVTLTHTGSGGEYEGLTAAIDVTATDDDTPSLRVSQSSLTVPEDGSATYTIRLNTQPTATVTVTVGGTTAEVTVDTDRDTTGDQTTLTFTTATWDTNQTVTVSATDDDDATDESVNLTHGTAGGDYTGLLLAARPGVAVTVDDDDTPAILIDADPNTANMDEAGPLALNELAGGPDKSKNYTVRLATEPTQTVTVAITSGDGAVTVGTSALTFTTANWGTAQTVTATAAEDDDASDERVAIAHAASGGDYAGVSAQLIATTVDDDMPALMVTATALTTSGVAEGATATYMVQLATEPDGVAVVSVAASGGPVSVDMDGQQAGLQSSVAFDATTWNMARTVTVRGLEDDDATAGMATLRHTASGADYGQAQAVDVGPFAVADDDTAAVTVEPTTMDVHEGSTATYAVTLATAPVGGPATIAVASSDTDVATVSPATLAFTAGNWNMPRQVTVNGVVDSDATEETVTISHTVSGADYGSVTAASVTARVLDAERPGLRIEPLRLTVREGESASYRMRLNTQPTGDVTVTETSDSTALSLDSDGTPRTLSLTFTTADWNTEQTVTVEAASDDDADDVVTRIQHNVTGYTGVATAPDVPVRIEDDEAVGVRFDPEVGPTLTEGGGAAATGTYTVVLTAQPTASVTLALSSDDAGLAFDADGATQGDQTSMTFTTANWNTAQTVTARAEADGDAASETATLLHAGSGGGYGDVAAGYAIRLSDADAAAAPGGVSAASAGPTSLMVTWTASANAQSYLVRWRVPGTAWSTARQLAVTGTTARIDGLETGSRYEVRVLGVNRGAPGAPSASAVATPLAGAAPDNRAPEPVGALADMSLAIGETRTVDVSGAFVDPDGDALTLAAWSLDESVATAWVLSGGQLRVRGNGVGVATVMVRAMDADGLTATRQLRATVGVTLSLAAEAEAPEGGTARLVATLSVARAAATTFNWRVMADMDAATVDADAGEHGDASGEATIAAGETTAEIAIAIADDDDIEPAREWFDVVLDAPADGCCVVREARARVAVLEGVCDRTPAVADALRRDAACTAPTPATLATRTRLTVSGAETLRAGDFRGLPNLRWLTLAGNALAALPEDVFAGLGLLRELDISGNALATLPPEPFSGLSRLRLLDLSGNAFETLPAGLFAGLFLREASLEDNPGAPFPLAAELTRTDAEPSAAGPATVEARLPSGAPFPLRLPLTAAPALETLPATVVIPAGATAAAPFAASAPAASALVLRAGAATLPAATCGDEWPFRACFRGLAPQPSATLTLFRQPPRALPAPEADPLAGDVLRLPLASLVMAGDGALRWSASSSDESVATVRVVGDNLLVEPEPGAEGTTEIVLVATDAAGLTATVRFTVRVEFFAPTRPNAGWRTALPGVAPATP